MAPRKNAQSTAAEVSLVHLKNCLVNLPPNLVSLLVNVNTPAQNVVVELSFRATGGAQAGSQQRSVFVGWTGMPSKRKAAAPVGRDGINGARGSSRDQDSPLVEMDATLAVSLGLLDGQRVMATVHVDPPLAHTINIEPLTPEDWEIIELHATFLELNLQSQVRALPNPTHASDGIPIPPHTLTLHLSPTSTANIKVVSLDPAPAADVPFVKLSPNAEVIVAPKVRAKSHEGMGDHRSVASTSKSRRSGGSTVRRRGAREESKPALFFRGVDRSVLAEWFDVDAPVQDTSVWIDSDIVRSGALKDVNYVVVDIMRPAGLQKAQPEDEAAAAATPTSSKIVAHLRPWEEPPNGQTIALSSALCAAVGCSGLVGGVVKIQPAPQQLTTAQVQQIMVYPFAATLQGQGGLKFGGESKAEKEESVKQLKNIYSGSSAAAPGLLQGPLTDGAILGVFDGLEAPTGWEGGLVKFVYGSDFSTQDVSKDTVHWLLGLDSKTPIEFQQPVPRPPSIKTDTELHDLQPSHDSILVGIDSLLSSVQKQLSHMSSLLLTGGMGSGKTSVAKYVAQRLREDGLFYTVYFPCRKLVTDETRISTIKDTLNHIFMSASWGARLGGKAIVVLDDMDKLCPVETELQVGNDNGRSRQVSETICSVVRQYCTAEKGVVLLGTAEGKDSLNNVVVGGHVVRDFIELAAPDKEVRRRIMESIVMKDAARAVDDDAYFYRPGTSEGSRPTTADGSSGAGANSGAWMGGSEASFDASPRKKNGGFLLEDDVDFLDIAGTTDGYMPGDLAVYVSRARNEAIIRSLDSDRADSSDRPVPLGRADFDKALQGFTPASLRNVSLQSSTTTFKSIGGLKETRKVLLETLQYPTKYAPIFAQCPLRLRSGLLLYGYPGCGKTLLASAVAGECGLNFISVKGPEILNKYIGASEKSVRDLFDRAQAAKPCVLFFDEFDSIAPKRGHDSTGVTDRVVNQLLTQMDGAEGLSGVYVLAATSRPDLIDPALLRPGRLDKSLLCDLPSAEDRLDILQALLQKVRLDGDVGDVLADVAQRTEGYSGADIQALVSNSQLEAIHDAIDNKTPAAANNNTTKRSTAASGRPASSSSNFVQFHYGANTATDLVAPKSKAASAVERAAIISKLEGMKLARRRAREPTNPDVGGGNKGAVDSKEVVVRPEHIERALSSTRASISRDELTRLRRIYHEFVVGRSGQLKDGQGSMEIGGRSSLM
ncbi:peroxin-1 [Geosmithia morbida]|uniref:Peroxisomal ATPase PEX1 n=1 Tax=Geosmithia morbida TaxID=1094350 RepID=A0A9P4YVJ1_9HYPO|nr:peroxin-1 [Geosmithia morbida]KAF4123893.1 peroxin-1 [Geosmithia morbida]